MKLENKELRELVAFAGRMKGEKRVELMTLINNLSDRIVKDNKELLIHLNKQQWE